MRAKILEPLLIVVWMVGISAVSAAIMAPHTISWRASLNFLNNEVTDSWSVTHVLGADCKCSKVVFASLMARGPQSEIDEKIVLLGHMQTEEKALLERGFRVSLKDQEVLSEEPIGVPFILIQTPTGAPAYSGGYSSSPLSSLNPPQDLKILNDLRSGKNPGKLPIFGCAMSARLQKLSDPFSLKYRK